MNLDEYKRTRFRRVRVPITKPKKVPQDEPKIRYKRYRRELLYLVQQIKVRCAVHSWRFWQLKHILRAFCTVVANELAKDNKVTLMGFGTFNRKVSKRGKVTVEFKAGKALLNIVYKGWAGRNAGWSCNPRHKGEKREIVL